ncbi:3-oxoacid CoA-transferase subunit B [Albimonas sp. CAU 1670]|uniref:3-oxoacid CoA-transferase subunit B n=1 Tax=Albimonas sp. CAU 1670 TaxID=3032599 RepID=UPI0023DC5B16|nr:3-oxoacid CoA-transferase subunit B [Albimonas sp. CAU 1670]MDF2233353.1 3-oxoacid CoA-transferase subunit B [Albimonas sp. CAU 1670]
MTDAATKAKPAGLSRKQMAWRAAQDIPDGSFVNLGIGMPELAAQYVPDGRRVTYHSENGILGFGEGPAPEDVDWDLINAGKKPVTLNPGASIFHHADSFAMIRGGHIDLALLGAFQIAPNGDLANWRAGNDGIPAVGGAMDLVSGAKEVWCITEHTTKTGEPKLVDACSYPLTGIQVVTRIYTNLGVVHVVDRRFVLKAVAPGVSPEEVAEKTGAPLDISGEIEVIAPPAA